MDQNIEGFQPKSDIIQDSMLSEASQECGDLELINTIQESKNLEIEDETEHNYFSYLYKKTGGMPDQSKRREYMLKEQKRQRNKLTDSIRGILHEDEEKMESQSIQTKNKSTFKQYRNKIMLSEWLIDVPEDLDVSWFLKLCPLGHRCLVVAHKNSAKSYSKIGNYECKFQSVLPGASFLVNNYKRTILDCVWIENKDIFYVLDVLMWAGQDLTQYDAEFRFFWLQSRMNDLEELNQKTSNNTYPFIYVPHVPCTTSSISDELEVFPKYPNNLPMIDGALFYHREASYTAGKTPLVGWLKPYMIPEILDLLVAPEYLALKPAKYTSLKNHIEYAQSFKKNKKAVNNEMETEATMQY